MKLPKTISIKYQKLSIKKVLGIFSITVIVATLYLILNTAPTALAQETQRTYTIVNPQIKVTLDPGGRSEGTTKVINQTDAPLTFNLNVQDFTVTDNFGTPNVLPPNTLSKKYSAAAWIAVTPTTFTVQQGKQQIVNYYIQVPKDAKPGGHYAAIVYSPASKGENNTGGIVKTEVGSLFYVAVNGPITEKSIVSRFFANNFQEYGPVKVFTQIQNLGDLHITPQGTIKVTGLFLNQTQKLASYNIFPEASREYQNSFGQALMIGRYKASLVGSYGVNNNLPLVATAYFWVFPWRIAVVIVLAIIAIILGVLYLKKRGKATPKQAKENKSEPIVPQ
jgi:hypothetical protein